MKNDMRIGDDLIIIEEADFRGAVEAPRKVESSTFIIVEKGTSRLVLDGVEYALNAPSVVVLMHDQTFQLIEVSEDISFKAIVMSQRFVDSLFGLYHQSDKLYSMIHDNPVLDIRHDEVSFRTFYSILVNAVISPVKAFRLESARHATLSMLYYYARRLESVEHEKTKADARYEQFCRDVRSFYMINRTLVFYAGRLGISVKYLTDLVKEKTGMTAAEYIDEQVVTECKAQLSSTDKSINQISRMMSFPSPSVFAKFFKRMTDVSPSDYRQQTR